MSEIGNNAHQSFPEPKVDRLIGLADKSLLIGFWWNSAPIVADGYAAPPVNFSTGINDFEKNISLKIIKITCI